MSHQKDLPLAVNHPDYLIDMKYITELTSMTDKWFYALIQKELFPRPIKLGRSSRWRLKDIEAWIAHQLEQSQATTKAA